MNNKENQKVAVVTGGTRGIGRAITKELLEKGLKVFALFARNSKAAESLAEEAQVLEGELILLRGDITREDKFAEVIAAIKDQTDFIDVVVHSAASGVHREANELSLKHLKWTFEINVFSIHHLLTSLFPLLRENSRVIGISSNGAQRVLPYYTSVGSSKGALESLFRHYAREWAPKGIAVNCICPGMVMTEATNAFPDREERIQQCISMTPTGSMTTPEDVAQLVSFLALNSASRQIVGQTIVLDGGKGLLA